MNINQNKNNNDAYFMRLALQQAERVLGKTKDNPAVGCVIIKNNHVISAGHTGIKGRPHAEYNTITYSKYPINNGSLYVTLEPCSHYGRTPPCIKIIIKNKIKRVFFSIKDPDLRSYNKSSKQLRKNKIKVKNGILKSDIINFYKSYIKNKKNSLPYVTAKLAVSKDYFSINKKNEWITNEFSRGRVHLMRSSSDCILTSVNTVIIDNPRLTCRIPGLEKSSPSRIILDKELKIPLNSNVVKSSKLYRSIIFFNKKKLRKIKLLKKLKIKLIHAPIRNDGNFDLKKILLRIRKLGFSRIFIESGLKLTKSFLNKNLVDEFKLFISNKNLGKYGDKNFKKYMKQYFKKKSYNREKVNLLGDKLISYRFK